MLEKFTKCLPVDIKGIGKGKNGMGKNGWSRFNELSCTWLIKCTCKSMLDFEGKLKKGNHRLTEVELKKKNRPLVSSEVLSESRNSLDFYQLFHPSGWGSESEVTFWEFSSWLQLLHSYPCKKITLFLTVYSLTVAVTLCLSDGLLNLQNLPWLHEGNCFCGTVKGRHLIGRPPWEEKKLLFISQTHKVLIILMYFFSR